MMESIFMITPPIKSGSITLLSLIFFFNLTPMLLTISFSIFLSKGSVVVTVTSVIPSMV